jgi:hypothetical protein
LGNRQRFNTAPAPRKSVPDTLRGARVSFQQKGVRVLCFGCHSIQPITDVLLCTDHVKSVVYQVRLGCGCAPRELELAFQRPPAKPAKPKRPKTDGDDPGETPEQRKVREIQAAMTMMDIPVMPVMPVMPEAGRYE